MGREGGREGPPVWRCQPCECSVVAGDMCRLMQGLICPPRAVNCSAMLHTPHATVPQSPVLGLLRQCREVHTPLPAHCTFLWDAHHFGSYTKSIREPGTTYIHTTIITGLRVTFFAVRTRGYKHTHTHTLLCRQLPHLSERCKSYTLADNGTCSCRRRLILLTPTPVGASHHLQPPHNA